jgi:curved DNA-binding protein CbpA
MHDYNIDHYAVLGLSFGASIAEIKTAYKKMARKYHPDKYQGDGDGTKLFQKIQQSYEALIDDAFRTTYHYLYTGFSNSKPQTNSKPETEIETLKRKLAEEKIKTEKLKQELEEQKCDMKRRFDNQHEDFMSEKQDLLNLLLEQRKLIEKHERNAKKQSDEKELLEAKLQRMIQEKSDAQRDAQQKLDALKKREKARIEKERLEELKKRETERNEKERKDKELLEAQGQRQAEMNYSYEGAKAYINTELLKVCAKDVRHNTDASGLEWYSVIDFMIRVCTDKTKKETYKTWDFFKSKSKYKSEIESFTRRVDFAYESIVIPSETVSGRDSKTPAATLSGLHKLLTILKHKHVGKEYHVLVNAALFVKPT